VTPHRIRRAALFVALLALTGCRFGAPPGSSIQGRDIGNLYHLFFYAAIGVGGLVYGLILWSVFRYRKRGDELPEQTRSNVPLEITYTVIPLLIVVGLFVATFRTERRVDRVSRDPAVVVNVTGFQWGWRFSYPAYGITVAGTSTNPPTVVVPTGQTVQVNLFSPDVIHSFFVPDFLFKRDAIPGFPNHFDLVIPRAGSYRGECAEFCGLDHAFMTFTVKAVPPSDFQLWAAHQAMAPGTPA
jgi:cytochrome c oxidase subunit 2